MTRQQRFDKVMKIITERGQIQSREKALELAARAYKLSHEEPMLDTPWPQLAAYRYAREILKKKSNDIEQLQKAADLMQEAAKVHGLGPLPLIYRVALLERVCLEISDEKDRDRFRKAADTCYTQAVARAQSWYTGLYDDRMDVPNMADYASPISSYFNLLEVISIVRKSENILYDRIPGSNPFCWQEAYDEDINGEPSRWVLVSHVDGLSSVPVPKAIAFQHLESRRQAHPEALFFRISDSVTTAVPPISEYALGRDGEWQPLRYGELLLLAYSLTGVMVSLNKMKAEINKRKIRKKGKSGEDNESKDNYFRQQKLLLRRFLKKMKLTPPGCRNEDILHHDPQKKALRLNPLIPVYGVIDEKLLPRVE